MGSREGGGGFVKMREVTACLYLVAGIKEGERNTNHEKTEGRLVGVMS